MSEWKGVKAVRVTLGKEVGFLVASRLTGIEVLGGTGSIGECADGVGL